MVALIYVKWWYPVDSYVDGKVDPAAISALDGVQPNIATSPSIITLIIGDTMGLAGLADPNNELYLWFDAQQTISDILVYITVIMLPTMLCAVPCIFICCGPKDHHNDVPDEFSHVSAADEEGNRLIVDNDDDLKDGFRDIEDMLKQHYRKEESHGEVGEIFIHSVIETIEFVLGCISNTASYLRLWALSLAHGKLGETFLTIFFTQLLSGDDFNIRSMSTGAAAVIFFIIGFGFMFAVLCVLFMMDTLEVFLHTMRLHWVEFMGKFFEGAG